MVLCSAAARCFSFQSYITHFTRKSSPPVSEPVRNTFCWRTSPYETSCCDFKAASRPNEHLNVLILVQERIWFTCESKQSRFFTLWVKQLFKNTAGVWSVDGWMSYRRFYMIWMKAGLGSVTFTEDCRRSVGGFYRKLSFRRRFKSSLRFFRPAIFRVSQWVDLNRLTLLCLLMLKTVY